MERKVGRENPRLGSGTTSIRNGVRLGRLGDVKKEICKRKRQGKRKWAKLEAEGRNRKEVATYLGKGHVTCRKGEKGKE